jgi:hypothetical protein
MAQLFSVVVARAPKLAENEARMRGTPRRREAWAALGVTLGVLLAACAIERVTAVEEGPGGNDASSVSPDAAADVRVADESSGSTEGDAPVPPACSSSNAVCKCDNNGCNVGGYYLLDNQFNCGADSGHQCGTESAYGCKNPDGTVAWVVTSNQPEGNTLVLTYPDMQLNFNAPYPPLSSFHSITATFEETSQRVGSGEDTFDIWLDGQARQVMVLVDSWGQLVPPPGSQVGPTTLDGRTYQVWWSSTNPAQTTLVSTETFTSGTVNLLHILNYAITNNFVPPNPTISQINFGVQIASTDGQDATFTFNDFSMVAQ